MGRRRSANSRIERAVSTIPPEVGKTGRIVHGRIRDLAEPLRQHEVRLLFGAQLVSGLGDWAGRLALAILVFDRSGSAWWTAAVTLVSLLPWLGPGQVLSTLADRFGRILVMIIADLVRAAIFLAMVAPIPVSALLALAFCAGLCVPPFQAARGAAVIDVLPPERYGKAIALFGVASQAELVIGYALGGVVIATVGPRSTLALNAITFVVSAAIVSSLRRSSASDRHAESAVGWAGVRAGARIWRDDALCRRALVLFVGVNMFMILPEALLVPYADELEAGSAAVGVLAATIAVGNMIAMALAPTDGDAATLLRVGARRAMVLAAGAAVLFVFSATTLPRLGVMALLLTGAVDAIAVPTNQVVGARLPRVGRAAAMSVAGGAQYGSQAIAIAIGGILAEIIGSGIVLTAASGLVVIVTGWSLLRPPPVA